MKSQESFWVSQTVILKDYVFLTRFISIKSLMIFSTGSVVKTHLLISSDCFGIQEHCHCLSYNIKPYSEKNADLALLNLNGTIILRILSAKGEDFVRKIPAIQSLDDENIIISN